VTSCYKPEGCAHEETLKSETKKDTMYKKTLVKLSTSVPLW
jgi:hypothetical protein